MKTNWGGNLRYGASGFRRAGSVAEVQDIVAASDRLRVLGSRHSFSDIADTAGIHLSLEDMGGIEAIDPERRKVTVGGGIRYADLARGLQAQGWALANMASLPHISVAGAVVTATHGSGSGIGNLATAVAAIEFVTGRGEVLRLARGEDAFAGAVVNLGALGVMVRLTLDIEPTYDVRQTVYLGLSHDVLAEAFEAVFAAGTSVSVFTGWQGARAHAVWVKDRVRAAGAPPNEIFGARAAEAAQHPLPGAPAESCTVQMGVAGPWHERLPHFRPDVVPSNGAEIQAEYFLPRDRARQAIAVLRRHGDRLAPVLMVSEVRTVAADGLWLSPSRGEPYFGLHFTFRRDWEAIRAVLPALEADLAPLGAVPHWGKVTTMAPEQIAARYPRMAEFRDLVAAHDPAGRLRNGFVERMVFGRAG
ncbi:FAD-binding protein [Neotabrizicola shimadae]|uniref:FAD-binding protein n=1 Tax=Neotabrizicola shimadae TaxID=2807096 RepID=A0A8G0ZXT5_9RHOB|nr:FAD-binding protein [Neotabrizicola shimadae]QYZ70029.1 FAD-binding protein [Neotabrizicola shimadae]